MAEDRGLDGSDTVPVDGLTGDGVRGHRRVVAIDDKRCLASAVQAASARHLRPQGSIPAPPG